MTLSRDDLVDDVDPAAREPSRRERELAKRRAQYPLYKTGPGQLKQIFDTPVNLTKGRP